MIKSGSNPTRSSSFEKAKFKALIALKTSSSFEVEEETIELAKPNGKKALRVKRGEGVNVEEESYQ